MKKLLIILFTLLFTFNAYAIQLGHGKGEAVPSAADVSGNTAEGRISWDSDDDKLYVGNGADVVEVASKEVVAFYAYSAADQSNVGTNYVTVVLGSELYDIGSDFASNTFTVPTTGTYLLVAQVTADGADLGVNGDHRIEFNKSGTILGRCVLAPSITTENHTMQTQAILKLTANDTITIIVRVENGTTDLISGSADHYTFFAGYKLD